MRDDSWIAECERLQAAGMHYKDLAVHFGVSIGTIAGALYRERHLTAGSPCYRKLAEIRVRGILAERREAALELLATDGIESTVHRKLVEAYGNGCTSMECGKAAGVSHAWANYVLRRYGLETARRFPKRVRDRALAAHARDPMDGVPQKVGTGARGMGDD